MRLVKNTKGECIAKNKTYSTLLLDPPWDVEQKGALGAINHYPLMTLDRIKALPVPELLDEDSHAWLWVTAATLEKGYELLRGWGLTPRSIFIWIKPRMGLGVYLRNCAEFIILATKGKAPIEFKGQMNYGFFPLQEHSHKPEEVHKIIERCSPGTNGRLEMFARRRQHGWDCWGNEIDSDVNLEAHGFPVPKYSLKAKTIQKTTKGGEDA